MEAKLQQKEIPGLARAEDATKVFALQRELRSSHVLHLGDARDLSVLPKDSVHLAITSPPYWTLKKYEARPGQLGIVQDYEEFHSELDKVWTEVFRVLVPGGRLICVVGDVCLSRRKFGRHVV